MNLKPKCFQIYFVCFLANVKQQVMKEREGLKTCTALNTSWRYRWFAALRNESILENVLHLWRIVSPQSYLLSPSSSFSTVVSTRHLPLPLYLRHHQQIYHSVVSAQSTMNFKCTCCVNYFQMVIELYSSYRIFRLNFINYHTKITLSLIHYFALKFDDTSA